VQVDPKLVTCLPESGLDVLDVDLRAAGSGHEEIIQRGLAAKTAVIQGGAASGRTASGREVPARSAAGKRQTNRDAG